VWKKNYSAYRPVVICKCKLGHYSNCRIYEMKTLNEKEKKRYIPLITLVKTGDVPIYMEGKNSCTWWHHTANEQKISKSYGIMKTCQKIDIQSNTLKHTKIVKEKIEKQEKTKISKIESKLIQN
jgi:hypothetical protein